MKVCFFALSVLDGLLQGAHNVDRFAKDVQAVQNAHRIYKVRKTEEKEEKRVKKIHEQGL